MLSSLDQIDFDKATLAVRRAKRGMPSDASDHGGCNARAAPPATRAGIPKSPFVFTSERGSPVQTSGFAKLIERAGEMAETRLFRSRAYVAPRLRLQIGERWCGYEIVAALSRPQEHSTYRQDIPNFRRIASRTSGNDAVHATTLFPSSLAGLRFRLMTFSLPGSGGTTRLKLSNAAFVSCGSASANTPSMPRRHHDTQPRLRRTHRTATAPFCLAQTCCR